MIMFTRVVTITCTYMGIWARQFDLIYILHYFSALSQPLFRPVGEGLARRAMHT